MSAPVALQKVPSIRPRLATALPTSAFLLLAAVSGSAVAGDLEIHVRDQAGNALADAVVFATPLAGTAGASSAIPHATIDQVNKEFVPLVSVIRTGTTLSFPNSDNIRHSIYSFSPAKVFTTKLYSGKQAQPVVFDKPGLVVLGCNIHDTMVAWVVVVDTPHFAKSAPDGAALLKDLEPGEYRLAAWYPAPRFEPHVDYVHVSNARLRVEVALDTAGSPLPAAAARAHAGH